MHQLLTSSQKNVYGISEYSIKLNLLKYLR